MTRYKTEHLGNLCDILDSKRKPITKRDRISGVYPYYGATGLLDYVSDFIFDEPLVLIGEDGAKWGAGEKTAFAVDGKCWVNNHAHVIRPHRQHVLDKWLIYYLVASDLSPYITGLTVPKLNQTKLRDIPIPVPPLPEQKRIIATLDEALTGIGDVVASAKYALANAREIFRSHLNSFFACKEGLWAERKLAEIGRLQTGTTPKTSEGNNLGTFIPFIKPGDFKKDGSIDYENEGLSELGLKQSRRIAAGSALMVCIGATIGKAGFTERDVSTNQQINAVTPINEINGKFVYYQMISDAFQAQVIAKSAKATLPIINKSNWGSLRLILASTAAEQELVVTRFDRLSAEVKRLEMTYKQKIIQLAALEKVILQKAFAGKLDARSSKV